MINRSTSASVAVARFTAGAESPRRLRTMIARKITAPIISHLFTGSSRSREFFVLYAVSLDTGPASDVSFDCADFSNPVSLRAEAIKSERGGGLPRRHGMDSR